MNAHFCSLKYHAWMTLVSIYLSKFILYASVLSAYLLASVRTSPNHLWASTSNLASDPFHNFGRFYEWESLWVCTSVHRINSPVITQKNSEPWIASVSFEFHRACQELCIKFPQPVSCCPQRAGRPEIPDALLFAAISMHGLCSNQDSIMRYRFYMFHMLSYLTIHHLYIWLPFKHLWPYSFEFILNQSSPTSWATNCETRKCKFYLGFVVQYH